MVSRQNINGRPRPSGVLQTVQDGPAAGLADPTPTALEGATSAGAPPTGSARGRGTGRRGRGGRRGTRGGINPDLNGEEEDFPDTPPPTEPPPTGETPPYPPGKGPPIMVPPTQPQIIPGGSRSGGGAGYRARTGKIARETTEAQETAGARGRFGEQHVGRYGRTHPGQGQGLARYPSGPAVPRWATGVGGEGYGTDPGPLPEPEPEPEPEIPPPTGLTDEEREARRLRREERRRNRTRRGRRGRLR